MMSRMTCLVVMFLAVICEVCSVSDAADPPTKERFTQEQLSFYEKNIRPVLASKCYNCHSARAAKLQAGLLLDTRSGILKGGDSGASVVPGKPDDSLLIRAIRYTDQDTQMPPAKAGGKLSDDVIANFEKWVRMGAPGPNTVAAKTSADLNKKRAEQFWAFQLPKKSKPPTVNDSAWPRNDIDRFVLAALEEQRLHPVADAEPRALLRRVYFDLIGMPPTIDELNDFLAECDKGPQERQAAFTAVVDRLLQSPQFGERWGRHWLDVARYAESTGKESNNLFPTAWRYRDYVIKSFNDNKPYDQFIREQIAGDLLSTRDAAQHNERITATGFLALGTKNIVEKDRLVFRMDVIDEQIDTVSRAVLGLTVACARCHDHKYDPITMRDYYALAGIFRSTETLYGTSGRKNKGTNASSLLPLADESKPLPAVTKADSSKPAVAESKPNGKRKKKGKKNAAKDVASDAGTTDDVAHAVMGVRDGKVVDCPVYLKGDTDDPGDKVPRGLVAVMTKAKTPLMPSVASGRYELAQWLTAKDNPLTARVMVNRVWQHLFGEGLVRTADNFGATGELPTHPELLDDLAVRFMESGWSVKKLVREIVLSRSYSLSTSFEAANADVDPSNHLLWRANPRRLDAEAIRDAMLTASGLIDLNPPSGSAVAAVGNGLASKYSTKFVDGESRNRSVYLPVVRDFVPSCLEVFDFAEPSFVVANRGVTNVPSQALYLMNNPFVIEQSKALARRVAAVSNLSDVERISLAYQHALGRLPTEAERTRIDAYLRAELGTAPRSNRSSPTNEDVYALICQSLFASAEFRYLMDAQHSPITP